MLSQEFRRELRREAPPLLRMALPLIAAQITFVSMGTVDTILAGRLGAKELAAVAVGANVWFLFFVLFMGLFMACSPIVAQHAGAGRDPRESGTFLRGAVILAVVLGLVWTASMWLLMHPVLDTLRLDPVTRSFAEDFIGAVSWGGVPLCLCFVLRNAAEGLGLTRVPLVAGVVGLAVNAGAGYVLMYGRLGLPALGPQGCGFGSMIASWAMVLAYVAQYLSVGRLRAFDVFRRGWPQWRSHSSEILRLGGPIALILAAEAWLFIIGALLMARFGGEVVAAHQIAINFASLMFMVPLSIGLATTVRVGHAAGAGWHAAVRLRGQAGMFLGALFALFSAALMGLFPEAIVAIYTNAPQVSALAAQFLVFAALFQLFDCVQATANGALRGIKDTRVPMVITLAAYWIVGMPLAAWLAFSTSVGPFGVWWGFIAGLGIAALGLALRFLDKTSPKRSVLMP